MGNFAEIRICRERWNFFFIYHAKNILDERINNYRLDVLGEYTDKYEKIVQFVKTNLNNHPNVYYLLTFGRKSIPLKFMEDIGKLVEDHNGHIKKVTLDRSLDI